MEIQQLSPDEWEIYRDIRLESLRVEPRAFMSKYEEEASRPEADWRKKVPSTSKPYSIKLFAMDNSKAVGMSGAYQDRDGSDPEIAHVFGVYVSPEYRGKGLGKELMQSLITETMSAHGIDKLRLQVKKSQTAAARLYQSLGFTIYGESESGHSYLMELKIR